MRKSRLARALWGGALGAALWHAACGAEPTVELVVVRADTLIGLSQSLFTSPGAWREVARLNHIANADRILPGEHLRVPLRLLRSDGVGASVVSVTGPEVSSGGAPAVLGAQLAEGQSLQTGAGSSAVLALADGSRVRVPPSSLAEVAVSRRYGGRLPANAAATPEDAAAANAPDNWFAGSMRVLRGSLEVFATHVLRAKPLEVVTPTAVIGVRGTRYRVALDEGPEQRTHAEVLNGVVTLASERTGEVDLRAGYGVSVDGGSRTPTVAALLPPPALDQLPARFERPNVRFTPGGVPSPLRVQVAADPDFDQIVSDQRVPADSEVRIAGLDDASWYLRARRIDPQGIEGVDSVRPFVLKARPEPPAYLKPRSAGKLPVGGVDFAWAQNAESPRVRLQIAPDPDFRTLLEDRDGVEAADFSARLSEPGVYYWRLASIRPSGDHGPFGDPQSFELRPLPQPPVAGRSADGNALVFSWSGRAGDRQQVEFARDKDFKQIVAKDESSASEWSVPVPSSGGRYYFRYRTIEPDGFISPYSEPLMVDVPRDWSGLGLLLPFLLLL